MADMTACAARLTGLVAIAGIAIAAGAGVGVVAFLAARYGPVGSGWSFRGNGALAVYAAVPALLAMGWTAAIVRHPVAPHWLAWSTAAGLVGLILALADALLLPLLGIAGDRMIGPFVLFTLLAWTIIAPLLALLVLRGRKVSLAPVSADSAAAVLGLVVGLAVTSVVLPPGS